MKARIILMMLILLCYAAIGQDNHPVSWKVTGEKTGPSTYTIRMEASVKSPYHIYPQGSSGSGLGMPTQFSFKEDPNVAFTGAVIEKGSDQKGNEILPYYANGATFTQTLQLKDEKPTTISFVIKYMACTDQMCLPPSKKQFTVTVGGDSAISTQTANSATTVSNKKTELPYQHFIMANTTGKSVSTKSIVAKNKYTFIDFWASWCTPCRKQARQLVPLYNKYRQKGFSVIGVSLDTEIATWKRAIKDDKYEWVNLSDLKGFESPIIKRFGITEIPRNILLDNKGNVIAQDLHSEELATKLDELFGKIIDQKRFVIEGKYGTHNSPAKAYLEYTAGTKNIIDSVILHEGNFKFTGNAMSSPLPATLIFDTKGAGRLKSLEQLTVYIEPGIIKVETKEGSVESAEISGTPYNNDYNDFNRIVDAAYAKMSAEDLQWMQGKVSPDSTPDYETKLEQFKERYLSMTSNAYSAFIKSHGNSSLSLTLVPKIAYDQPYDSVKSLFEGLSANVRNSEEGKKMAENLESLRRTAIGQPAPDFELPDTSGHLVKLSSFRGKYVLLDFWASWCGPCRAENPNLVKIYNRFKDQNFTIVGVSLDKAGSKALWLGAIKKDKLPWLQLSDLKFWNSPVAKSYGVQAIPQNFLIDPNGIIVGKTLMGKKLETRLNEILIAAIP